MNEIILGRDATVEISPDGEQWTPITAVDMAIETQPAPAPAHSREPRGTWSRHIRAIRLWRLRAILRTIPRDVSPELRARWSLYASQVVAACGRRQLARVVWPWQPRQKDAGKRMPRPGAARRAAFRANTPPRGRLSNPTAIR